MQALFAAIQEACTPGIWSRGVELVRAEAVTGDRSSRSELVFRVATRGGLVSPTVTLYPEDEDWECTCASQDDPCEHVAAAAIAMRQARKAGQSMPKASGKLGRLRYVFTEDAGGQLSFERHIVTGEADAEQVHVLTSTLDAIAKGRAKGPRFAATKQDMDVELTLGARRRGAIPRDHAAKLLSALAGHENVYLGDQLVAVSGKPVGLQAKVVDAPEGVRLYVDQDSSITRTFQNGIALCGDTLRALGGNRLTGREREELPRGRFFTSDRLAELVTEVLPDLENRIPIEILSERLPDTSQKEKPRIHLHVTRQGDRLSVLPTLVYGTPAVARVDAGKLVHIQGSIPIRDESAERARAAHLHRELGLIPGRRANYSGDEAIAFARRLDAWRGEIEGDAHKRFHRLPGLVPKLKVNDETLEIDFALPEDADGNAIAGGGAASASAEAVLSAWSEGSDLVALDGGGLAPLPEDWLKRFGHRVADLLAAREADGRLPPCALPALGRLCDELDEAPPPRLTRLRPILERFSSIPHAELPADFRGELREYQKHGVDWLCFLRETGLGALLADDMGLGKTVQALCALDVRSLVVAPTSLLHNWTDEIERFRPELRHCVYHGPKRELDDQADVVLTSYAILRIERTRLAAESWQTVVIDEAQNIKNPDSQLASAAYALRADFRIALTGTPVENRLDELWSQFHFLNRGLLGGRKDFQTRYARPIADGDAEAAERLRERIHPFVLRRLTREVAPELPPRTELVLHCELSKSEREVYDTVRAATVAKVVEQLRASGRGSVMAALEALLRLRQAACHSDLVPGQEASRSTKVDLLVERLDQAVEDGHKALVFSQWTALLDRIEPHLRECDIGFARLDGSTRNRAEVVAGFQSEEGPPVMLVSLRAGGTGLNLTAADHIFLMDPWWNPAVEDQAADRAHRIGQTRPVVIHRIVAENTVEEGILRLHERKRALSEVAVGGIGASEGLSREELLVLLDD